MMMFFSTLGLLLGGYLLFKSKNDLQTFERVVLGLLTLSFLCLLLHYFKFTDSLFLTYNILILLGTLGVLIIELKRKSTLAIVPLVIGLIWLLSSLVGILNLRYHFEILSGKLFLALPLSIFILLSKKRFDSSFTKSWVILFLVNLAFEVYNAYFFE